jgi:hypothetical protein
MKSEAQVLLIGKDEMLLRTRQLILGTFFQVEAAGRVSHAAGILADRHFDLVVLCYSLTQDECQKVIELIEKKNPSPQILTLCNATRLGIADVNRQEMNADGGPYALVKKCAAMLGVELKSIGRSSRAPVGSTPAFRL